MKYLNSHLVCAALFCVLLPPPLCASEPAKSDDALKQVLKASKVPELERYQTVSMIQLIANPEKYDSKKVIVFGYLAMLKEWQVIYFDENSYKNSIEENALGIDLSSGDYQNLSRDQRQELNCHYGSISGTFVMSTKEKGDFTHAGVLTNVQLIQASKASGFCNSEK